MEIVLLLAAINMSCRTPPACVYLAVIGIGIDSYEREHPVCGKMNMWENFPTYLMSRITWLHIAHFFNIM